MIERTDELPGGGSLRPTCGSRGEFDSRAVSRVRSGGRCARRTRRGALRRSAGGVARRERVGVGGRPADVGVGRGRRTSARSAHLHPEALRRRDPPVKVGARTGHGRGGADGRCRCRRGNRKEPPVSRVRRTPRRWWSPRFEPISPDHGVPSRCRVTRHRRKSNRAWAAPWISSDPPELYRTSLRFSSSARGSLVSGPTPPLVTAGSMRHVSLSPGPALPGTRTERNACRSGSAGIS